MVLYFINRVSELNSLESWYRSDKFEMVVIYGRRRIGKTYLLKKFLEKKDGFYFLCDRAGTENNLSRLKREFARHIGEPTIESNDVDDIFNYISRKIQKRTVIIIDEFSYLVEKDDSIPSVFQRIVDEIFTGSKIMLILCGSSISMMEEGVLSYRSPLYGRRSGQIKVRPIPFENLHDFFPGSDLESLVKIHSSLGSIPYYLSMYDNERSFEDNINKIIIQKDGKLYEEIDLLLKQELREPDIYKNVLYSVAKGSTRPVDISNATNIHGSDLSKYLNRLLSLGMIKKDFSITDLKSTRPHYSIDDNLPHFWFTFCEPFKSDLEIGELKMVHSNLKKNFNTYAGRRFEELVRRELIRSVIPFHPSTIGRFWNKEIEIDIVALDEKKKRGIFIEVKWSKVDPERELKSLEKKVEKFPWNLVSSELMIVGKEMKRDHQNCKDLADLMRLKKNEPVNR